MDISYLNGYAIKNTCKGFGPAVYLLITRGSKICKGTNGIAIKAICSLCTPASISFSPVTESVAANAI